MRFFSADLKEEALNFSLAVYRVTDLFPKTEPLRLKLRECALEIVTCANMHGFPEGLQEPRFRNALVFVETLRDLVWVSCGVGLMKAINANVLSRECSTLYAHFRHELLFFQNDAQKRRNVVLKQGIHGGISKDAENVEKLEQNNQEANNHGIRLHKQNTRLTVNDIIKNSNSDSRGKRQEEIVSYLRRNKEARIAELANIFSNRFSVKTLQRDLSRLIFDQKVSRTGDKRWAVYRLNSL